MFKKLFISLAIVATAMAVGAPVALAQETGEHAVYTATNSSAGNKILIFNQAANGTLTAAGEVDTGGTGTGGGLGNQSGVLLSDNGKTLLVVNAGSNDISVLRLQDGAWVLTDQLSSGGTRPVSITRYHDVVYVLNAGSDNISGFRFQDHSLQPINDSTRHLSGTGTSPAQIAFNPKGNVLLVTEKATKKIDAYTVDGNGIATGPIVQDSNGVTPFGFAYDKRGRAVISEAFGGTASAVSSYSVADDGSISSISNSVDATGQRAACWVVITKNGKFAYITNTATGTISSYSIAHNGALTLVAAVAANTGGNPIDISFDQSGRFLYTLVSGTSSIQGFRVNQANGSLTSVGASISVPTGTNGLAAR